MSLQQLVKLLALGGLAVASLPWGSSALIASKPDSTATDGQRYFPRGILHASWQTFSAKGFTRPVTGVVYRGIPTPTCGMPLGGLDTGCIDLEPNGMWGYSTIFNHLGRPHHAGPPRVVCNEPMAALAVGGETYLLATDARGKLPRPVENPTGVFPPTDYTPIYFDTDLKNIEFAKSIDYFGHYPIADVEFDLPAPVSVGLRAWSPVLPGDAEASMMPGAVFEFSIRNTSGAPQSGTLAFNFPGFGPLGEGVEIRQRELSTTAPADRASLSGIETSTTANGTPLEMSYVLAASGEGPVRTGGTLGVDSAAWNKIAQDLPPSDPKSSGSSLAVDFQLKPGETIARRIILAWYAPLWNAGGMPDVPGTRSFRHMYARHYPSAADAARQLAEQSDELLQRVIAWQEAVYGDQRIPGWLADCLINNLHLIAETSVWGQSEGPLSAFSQQLGLFALNECPRGCPQLECIPCSFYGNMPIVYFFPEAALSTLHGYKQYQFPDGRPPWIFGGVTAGEEANKAPYDLAAPDQGYQSVLNAACYVVMLDRYWQRTGDVAVLKEFYPSIKRANDFSMNLRPKYGLSQVMAMPEPGTDGGGLGDTEWFEAPEPGWKGYVTHAGGVRMAQIQIMRRMAEAVGDLEYVAKCDLWLNAGKEVLEDKLWNGNYYLNFNDPDNQLTSDLIFGYQLDGEWICDVHGVPGVFPKPRIDATLQTIRRANVALSQSGATNYANPDGTPAKVGGYGTYGYFPPELMMLAMTYMYEDQKELGAELLRRCLENIVCQWGYAWDAPNTIRGDMDTGQRHFGADYYQNMMLWFAPAALAGQDMTAPTKPGGLVYNILEASRKAP
ncbi:MAG: hypothetical protein IT424_07180 [Pirellulales bacterium]|nr:hypothetical protein [Pirellulales bacterium]